MQIQLLQPRGIPRCAVGKWSGRAPVVSGSAASYDLRDSGLIRAVQRITALVFQWMEARKARSVEGKRADRRDGIRSEPSNWAWPEMICVTGRIIYSADRSSVEEKTAK